ncbi:8704_t:CDS:2 [Paraglomus brasilianum]|uniref:8704_t:CDS:1 n=1 Tax=Paraglomus brasilianum TaxID=144538 RepID=A0A9N8ZZU8_9GLOM|nr:8704_t:CDS:2 [Paraglomus brasilianum]
MAFVRSLLQQTKQTQISLRTALTVSSGNNINHCHLILRRRVIGGGKNIEWVSGRGLRLYSTEKSEETGRLEDNVGSVNKNDEIINGNTIKGEMLEKAEAHTTAPNDAFNNSKESAADLQQASLNKRESSDPKSESQTPLEEPSTSSSSSSSSDFFQPNPSPRPKSRKVYQLPRQNFVHPFPIALILLSTGLTALGIYQFYTSNVNKYPENVRAHLRKALFYQHYGDDLTTAVKYYKLALTEALNDSSLPNNSPEVTGIMIQLGSVYEDLDKTRDAIDVYSMAYDAIVTRNNGNVLAKLEGDNRLRSIGLAQRLGDLHHNLKQDDQAEKYYVWSVEQLLGATIMERQARGEDAGKGGWFFGKKLDIDPLPSWLIATDLGASLEALAAFYSSRHKYAYALPLYLRALSLLNPPETSCHSVVLMNNISEVFTGMGNYQEARGWAERGLKLVEKFQRKRKSNQECEESYGVLLFNLGMISEITGNLTSAENFYERSRTHAKKIGFTDCVSEADNALQRIMTNNKEELRSV